MEPGMWGQGGLSPKTQTRCRPSSLQNCTSQGLNIKGGRLPSGAGRRWWRRLPFVGQGDVEVLRDWAQAI